MINDNSSDISTRIAAALGIFPEGKKETKIVPLYNVPKSIGDEELFLPYHEFWGFKPIDKNHFVEIDGQRGVLYHKDEKVKLQHYGYYKGDPAKYNKESTLCSGLFLKHNCDYSEWLKEVKKSYDHTIHIHSFKLIYGDAQNISSHTFKKSPIEGILSGQAFMGGGDAISTTYSDIAEGVSKMDRKMGFDPFNALGPVLHSDGLYVFDIEIPAEKIIIPQQQITSQGSVSRFDNFVFPEFANIEKEDIVTMGFFIYQNQTEHEILFTHKIPQDYVVGFRYFSHNKK